MRIRTTIHIFHLVIINSFLFVQFSSSLNAQINFGFATTQEYNSNPFRNRIPEASFISDYEFSLENESDEFSVGYYGDFYNFAQMPDWNFYWHQAAVWKDFENSTLSFYYEQRFNNVNTNYFDYYNFSGFYAHNFMVGNFIFGISPSVSLTKYPNIAPLDNIKGSFEFFVNRSFETKTTFILGGLFNYKQYLNTSTTEIVSYYDEQNNVKTDTLTGENISSLNHLTSYLRITQSITESTGLAVQYTSRNLFGSSTQKYKSLNLTYGDESEIFDDPVNYESNNFLVELTQVMFDDLVIKAGYYINNKSYPTQGIYDIDSKYDLSVDRSDTQNIFSFSLNKDFQLGSSGKSILSLGMNYKYIKNNSNSYWFEYNYNAFNVSIGLTL